MENKEKCNRFYDFANFTTAIDWSTEMPWECWPKVLEWKMKFVNRNCDMCVSNKSNLMKLAPFLT